MFYFYILENVERELYFGSTKDLKRRISEHARKKSYATKRSEWTLIYYEAYRSESDARTREARIKNHGQAKAQLKRRISESRLAKS